MLIFQLLFVRKTNKKFGPVKSTKELCRDGFVPIRSALGDTGVYINLETGSQALSSEPWSSLPAGYVWYTRLDQ